MRRRHLALAAVAVAAALTVSGCGGSDDDDAAADDAAEEISSEVDDADDGGDDGVAVEACDLLTDDEIAEVLGDDVEHGVGGAVGESTCEWHVVDVPDPTVIPSQVILSIGSPNTAAGDEITGESAYGPTEPVDGVGDGARISSGSLTVLEFPVDGRHCELQVVINDLTNNHDEAVRIATEIATKVRERL
jgi:hypothetical protein